MKVLEKGEWRMRITCVECKAQLLTLESDYTSRQGNGQELEIGCMCSECETWNTPVLPDEIRRNVFNRKPEQRPKF